MRIRSYAGIVPLVGVSLMVSAVVTLAMQLPACADTTKASADSSKAQSDTESCRKFVQQFYTWYTTGPQPKGKLDKYDITLKYKSAMFTPELMQKLHDDLEAAKRNPGEIVGLDFDPFTNAQDDPGGMTAKKATMKGTNCLVDVYRKDHDAKDPNGDVIPELTQKNGHWLFVNFHYPKASDNPANNDLIAILKNLAADRVKYKAK
ncbi:MAG TPA: hypothetical protein V6D22_25650 [Candidatus Obscuribacterales bacterium]